MPNSIRISEELLDLLVNAVASMPYKDAQPIFEKLAAELAPPQEPEPSIILN